MEPKSIARIFWDAAQIASPAEREAHLRSACGDDDELRQRVEQLLEARSKAENLFESPLPAELDGLCGRGEAEEAASCLDLLAPSRRPDSLGRLDHFEVLEVIGHGGMGVVLRALDEKLHRVVAIKVMASQLASNAAARKRFTREARAAAAVSHDHIVTIHAVDEAGGLPYLVMHYVSGVSLQQRLDRDGPLEPAEIVRIGMQTAGGLAAAHAQGLIHRDIKPANILLENGVERVKITDFGLARAADDVGITRTGEVTGTPHYMSPEQAQGQALDARSDLFSLGCVMYAMCTGRSPFRAETTLAALRRVCDDTPRPIREINPDVPGWLTAIIDRLLEKAPDDRFQTAGEVADALGRRLAHAPDAESTSRPAAVSCSRRRRGPWFRRLIAASALLLVVAVVLAEVTGVTNLSGNVMLVSPDDGRPVIESGDWAAERVPPAPPPSSIEQQIAELSGQIEHSREDGKARINRAHLYVRQGRWQDAADDLAAAEDAVYENPGNAFLYAILLVYLRQFDLHQRHCAKMLEHFDDTEDVWTANCLVKSSLLRPGVVDLDRLPTKLLSEDRELAIDEPAWVLREARALIAYRGGDFDGARRLVRETMELPAYKNDPLYAPRALAILAMAAHQSGETSLARNLYEQAVKRLEPIHLTSDDIRASSWLYAEILRREAAELLELEQTDTAPTGEPDAFVVFGADGVEHRFATLAEAVLAAGDGDTIEIHGNGPFALDPVAIDERLAIKAGSGFRPVLQPGPKALESLYLILTRAPLVLEGLEFRCQDSDPVRFAAIRVVRPVPLFVANCRALVDGRMIYGSPSHCEIRQCDVLRTGGDTQTFGGWRPLDRHRLIVDGCILGSHFLGVDIGRGSVGEGCCIELTRNTFVGDWGAAALWRWSDDGPGETPLVVEMKHNVSTRGAVLILADSKGVPALEPDAARDFVKRLIQYREQRNLFGSGSPLLTYATPAQQKTTPLVNDAAAWREFWGLERIDSLVGTVQLKGALLKDRIQRDPQSVTPDDFRLLEGSAGYRAGPDGKDLGADVDLVGPGEAYERWKKMPQYQQWLEDTRQAIHGVDGEKLDEAASQPIFRQLR